MKTTLTAILLAISLQLFAPNAPTRLYIPKAERIQKQATLDDLIAAVVKYESKGNTNAVNEKEQAYGAFQIRQCKLTDYNNQTGHQYTLQDMTNYHIARQVFIHFAKGKSLEKAARKWNGSGPKTNQYWSTIQKSMTQCL